MAVGGAQNLGTARGSIEISTSDLRNVTGVVRSVASDVSRQMGAIDVATKRTQAQFTALSRGIGQIKGELTGLTVGAGALTGLGIKTAGSFQESAIKLAGMVGGMQKAQALMDDLRKKSAAAGIPFADMLATAERLLPTFQGNTKELERWYALVRRVSVLNATEGMTGAAFSVNEAITSGGTDLVSLVERFNISRAQLRAELAANGNDFYDALDKVLTRMGITNETALQMGQTFNASFRATKDAAMQLLAEGFTPLLQVLTPILQKTALWLAQLRETNPAVAQVGAGLATVATVGAPALLLFNQLVEAGQKLKALGILGGLGRTGGVGLSVAAGVGLGIGATNAIGRATGNEKMANAGLSDLMLIIRKLISNIAFTLTELDRLIRTGLIGALRAMVNAVIGAASALGGVVSAIGSMLPGRLGGDALGKIGADLSAGGNGIRAVANQMFGAFDAMSAQITKRNNDALKGFIDFMVPGTFSQSATPSAGGGGGGGVAGPGNAERNKIISQWAKDAARIEREAGQARLDEERSYGQQRAQTIRQYNQNALREEEDFQRGRARAITQYNRQVAEAIADAAKRDAAWQKDYSEKVAELRADGNERLVELEQNYAKDRERRERDHRDRLLSAAARLDAVAVAEEQRNYARQQQDAQENYTDQRTKLQDALAERLADELEAHQERLQAAHEADAERLADMQRSFEEQIAEQDLERAIQQQRRAEDFAQQLAEMDQAHAERLAQIDTQAAQERQALNDAFVQQLSDLGIYNKAWRNQQAAAQAESLRLFGEFWKQFNQSFPGATQGPQAPYPGNLGQFPSSFADYGFGAQRAAAGGSVNSRSITIAEGAIVVNAAPNHDERTVARQVRTEMERILIEAAR